jgi:2'-5' RNA ligase
MHGLVSLLPQPYYQQVEDLWKELEEELGLYGIRVTPYPHFSWQIAPDYQFQAMETILRDFADGSSPLTVRTAGLGVFTGPRPVVFIPLVKTIELIEFHARLWESVLPASPDPSPYYHPRSWMPHITLAFEDVQAENIAGVMHILGFRPFAWEMQIDEIALIVQPSGEVGKLHSRYPFKST